MGYIDTRYAARHSIDDKISMHATQEQDTQSRQKDTVVTATAAIIDKRKEIQNMIPKSSKMGRE